VLKKEKNRTAVLLSEATHVPSAEVGDGCTICKKSGMDGVVEWLLEQDRLADERAERRQMRKQQINKGE